VTPEGRCPSEELLHRRMEGNLQAAGPAVNGIRHGNFVDNVLEVPHQLSSKKLMLIVTFEK